MSGLDVNKIVSINDMEMYFEARGDGQQLILLHGFTGSGADWQLISPSQHCFDLRLATRTPQNEE